MKKKSKKEKISDFWFTFMPIFLIIFLLFSTIVSFLNKYYPLSLAFFIMWLYSLTLIKDMIDYFKNKKEKEDEKEKKGE